MRRPLPAKLSGPRPLHRWTPGTRLRVVQIAQPATGGPARATPIARKLASLGILPGSIVTLVQLAPLPVIVLENSLFALDREAASMLLCVQEGKVPVL